jgi:hypothetical protein
LEENLRSLLCRKKSIVAKFKEVKPGRNLAVPSEADNGSIKAALPMIMMLDLGFSRL